MKKLFCFVLLTILSFSSIGFAAEPERTAEEECLARNPPRGHHSNIRWRWNDRLQQCESFTY